MQYGIKRYYLQAPTALEKDVGDALPYGLFSDPMSSEGSGGLNFRATFVSMVKIPYHLSDKRNVAIPSGRL